MKNKIIAKRYADAFLSHAKSTIGMERAVEELKDLKIVFFENQDFQKFLENPEILYKEKCEAVDLVLKEFSEETRNFLKLLLEKERIKNIIGICDYARINFSKGEAIDALLKTSYPLDLDLIEKIKQRLEAKFKKRLNLHIELDADLLGGVQVTVGNTQIDASVRRRLDDLKKKLIAIRI